MERLAQYLDDLEDLFYAALLLTERAFKTLQICMLLLASFTVQFLGILLALSRPPLALAVVSLTVVGMLYRSVTAGFNSRYVAAPQVVAPQIAAPL